MATITPRDVIQKTNQHRQRQRQNHAIGFGRDNKRCIGRFIRKYISMTNRSVICSRSSAPAVLSTREVPKTASLTDQGVGAGIKIFRPTNKLFGSNPGFAFKIWVHALLSGLEPRQTQMILSDGRL